MSLTFPVLPTNELVLAIRQKILTGSEAKNFSKNDLFPNAKPEVLQKIYMRMLQIILGYRPEHFYMMPVNIDVQYFNIYEGFIPIANLLTSMEKFLPMCRIYDFQLSDLLNPKVKRTNYCLSGILNFLVFRDDRRATYLELSSSYKSAMENQQQLQKANEEVEMKIQKLTTVPPEQQAEFDVLSSEINDLNHTLQHTYRAKESSLKEQFAQKKAEYAEKKKRLSELKLAIASMKEEQEIMKSQIVESPEERKSTTENMKITVNRLKMERQETNDKCEFYRDRVTLGSLWQSEIQWYYKKLQGLDAGMEKKAKILTEIRNVEDQIAVGNMDLKNLSTEETMAKRNLGLKKEKLIKLDMKIKKKREDYDQQKLSIIEACKHIQEKRETAHGQLNQIEREILHTRLKTKKLLESSEEQRKEVQEIFTGFKTGLRKYHDDLTRAREAGADVQREKINELKRRMNMR